MDFDGPRFDGFGPWWHIMTLVLGGFVWLLFIALMLAVLFFLIRFLLVATRAAQLYVNRHAPAEPARTPAATTAPAATTTTTDSAAKPRTRTAPAATKTTPVTPADTTAPTTPLTKPRTPRKPPTP